VIGWAVHTVYGLREAVLKQLLSPENDDSAVIRYRTPAIPVNIYIIVKE
jgi:hypothetical protein